MTEFLAPLVIQVRATPGASHGVLQAGPRTFACVVGRAGILSGKREGDGATPAGRFSLREAFWRPDRLPSPATALRASPLTPQDGWCDDPGDPAYNRRVRLPFAASHEALWRSDGLYDLLAVIGYNDAPPVPHLGSAIFLHVAARGAGGLEPTAGCVALALADLGAVLALCGPGAALDIALA
jgi:L,D-peptidoglycan transpeptidase YkuD (ErfK/YbiS/YcfS/YnhG family)